MISTVNFSVFHSCIFAITSLVAYICYQNASFFTWHPSLMTFSFFFLMNEAVVMFSSHLSLIPRRLKSWFVTIHLVLQWLSAIAAGVGFYVIYTNKNMYKKQHFTSWHGLIGLGTMVTLALQMTAGAAANYSSFVKSVTGVRPVTVKVTHVLISLVLTLLATVTLVTGSFSNWYSNTVQPLIQYLTALVFIVIGVWVSVNTVNGNQNRFRKALWSA